MKQKEIRIPDQFRDEQPDPRNFERFKRVMAALVAGPKAEALSRDAFQKALKKSKTKTTNKSSRK
jgi:hypothetical protein